MPLHLKHACQKTICAAFSVPSHHKSVMMFLTSRNHKPDKQRHLLFNQRKDQVEFGVSKNSNHPAVPASSEGCLLSRLVIIGARWLPQRHASDSLTTRFKGRDNGRRLRARLLPFIRKGNFQKPLEIMKFRTQCSKIWYLSILDLFSWRGLRSRRVPLTFPSLFPLKQVVKPWEKCPPYARRKGMILSPKRRQEESKQTGLVKFLPVYYTYLILPRLSYFYTKPGIKVLRFNNFHGSPFPCEDSHVS